jgi:hypothetical protein
VPNHDADSLKLLLPDVALHMESELIRVELCERLHLQAVVTVDGKTVCATVNLNDGFRLVIKPAVPGFNSEVNWFRWRNFPHPHTGENVTLSEIRASVELQGCELEAGPETSLISFGVDAFGMKQLISKALRKTRTHLGLRLVPLPELFATKPIHQSTPNKEST